MIDETGISTYKSKYQQIVAEAVKQTASDNLKAAERAYERIKAKLLAGEFDVVPISSENVLANGQEFTVIHGQLIVRVDIKAEGEPHSWTLTPWLAQIASEHGLRLTTREGDAAAVSPGRLFRVVDYVYLEARP